jgi:hypothetical protein
MVVWKTTLNPKCTVELFLCMKDFTNIHVYSEENMKRSHLLTPPETFEIRKG